MINSKKIKDRAKSLGIRQAEIAEKMNLRQPTVNQKINNVRPLFLSEAEKLAKILQIRDCEFGDYFFGG